jgi:drug/metabolite transporter (DMT)-like permease
MLRKAWLQLAAVYLAWGGTYIAIRIAVTQGFPPYLLAAGRLALAGAILLARGWASGARVRPTRRELGVLVASGLLLWCGGNGLVMWAEQHTDAGTAALFITAVPVIVALADAALDGRLPAPRVVRGLVCGTVGLGLLAVPAMGSGADARAIAALALAALTWSAGTVLHRRAGPKLDAVVSAGWQQGAAAVVFAVLSLATGQTHADPSGAAWWAFAYLVVVGSVIGFTSYLAVVRDLPAPIATSYAYVNPVVALVASFWLLGERPAPLGLLGAVVAIAGVVDVTLGSRGERPHPDGRATALSASGR